MTTSRWTVVSESEFPWEREALNYLRQHFPDQAPFRAWSNFEFIGEDGSLNEVDLLVVGVDKIFLVEIKSWPGRLEGDAGTWQVSDGSRVRYFDNPLMLTNRKCKKLKALLKSQPAMSKRWIPYVDPLIFLSSTELTCHLRGPARTAVHLRRETEQDSHPDILTALYGDAAAAGRIDEGTSRDLARAMDQAGIRPSGRERRIGDYLLETLIQETDAYQDWQARHTSAKLARHPRRIRLYPLARNASTMSREDRYRAAQREYEALVGINHPGITRASDFIESERGPALLFDYDPAAQRLDAYLQENQTKLGFAERLALVRELAEILDYAHRHRVYHRALSPQVIWAAEGPLGGKELRIGDWQAGKRVGETGSTHVSSSDSLHFSLFGDPQSLLYQAPESLAGRAEDPEKLDIFSLGALAYTILSGRPPAASIHELVEKCEAQKGLRLSDALDGTSDQLEDLIQYCTHPRMFDRLPSLSDFLARLSEIEASSLEPSSELTVHPLDAKPTERLEHGFTVLERLGKGGSSQALLVERDGKRGVLKVALDPAHNDRLVREGAILNSLSHHNIVELFDVLEVSGHAALFMAFAGQGKTLAQRLRDEGRLSLDLLQRFGDQLLETVAWLEDNGVSHRDLKPENIGIGETRNRTLTLVLFDFSLSGTPVEDIRAGTPPYLDPFLPKRKRWDLYAERFAAATTLYEMATGTVPDWVDGELVLDAELLDPSLRGDLMAFFEKAMHEDHRERFDNAHDMLKAWRWIFMRMDQPVALVDPEASPTAQPLPDDLTEKTPLAALGLSPRHLNALERMGAVTVGELLDLPRIRLYRNKGIGQKTVREIRELWERLDQRFAERATARMTREPLEAAGASGGDRLMSIDEMIRRLTSARLSESDLAFARRFLGLEGESWPSMLELAEHLALSRSDVLAKLEAARKRWSDQPWLSSLRDDAGGILERHAGVMTAPELAQALLAARGSTLEGEARLRAAKAALAAAVETEAGRQKPRFLLYRGRHAVFVVATPELSPKLAADPQARAHYAEALGARADALAGEESLPSPLRVQEDLMAVASPEGDPIPTIDRILRLAVAASKTAALSSRQELYPRGMEPVRALKLGAGSLLGPKSLSEAQVLQRIASRYPEAAPLPRRPRLDVLLQEAGLDLVWEDHPMDGLLPGYRPKHSLSSHASSSTMTSVRASTPASEPTPEAERIETLERRLRGVVQDGRFLVLTVAPKHHERAAGLLVERHGLKRRSLEKLFVEALQDEAKAVRARWDVVLRADAAEPGSRDGMNLRQLVRRIVPRLKQTLLAEREPVLLVENGLLERYEQVGLLESLREACASVDGAAPGFVVLVPSNEQTTMPRLGRKPIPVVEPSEHARIPSAWI